MSRFMLAMILCSAPALTFAADEIVKESGSKESSAIEIARGTAPKHPQQPQAVVDACGGVHVTFGLDGKIFYCRSNDAGKSYGKPVELPTLHGMSLGMRRGPRIAVASDFKSDDFKSSGAKPANILCITAIGGKESKTHNGDLLAFRSTDGGKTWLGPTTVNDLPDSAAEGLHAMAAGEGTICCVWLDLRTKKAEVMSSISTDGGQTWSKNVLVYRSPDGSVCECCHPSVTFGPGKSIHVMWRNSLAGNRDLYICSSSDFGKTFSEPVKQGIGTWKLDRCPMDGGAFGVTSDGKTASVWRRQKNIFLVPADTKETGGVKNTDAKTTAKEIDLGIGEQPWLTVTPEGPHVVWLKKRDGALMLLAPGDKPPVVLASHAGDPVIASGPTGHGPVVAVWEACQGKECAIHARVVGEMK